MESQHKHAHPTICSTYTANSSPHAHPTFDNTHLQNHTCTHAHTHIYTRATHILPAARTVDRDFLLQGTLSAELLAQFVADVGGMYASHLEFVCVPSRIKRRRTAGFGTIGDLRDAMLAACTADGPAELRDVLSMLVSEHSDGGGGGGGGGDANDKGGDVRMPRTVFDEERPGNVAVLVAAVLCACCRCPDDIELREGGSSRRSVDIAAGGACVCVGRLCVGRLCVCV